MDIRFQLPLRDGFDEDVRRLRSRLPIGFPKVVDPDDMKRGENYVLALRMRERFDLVGPFQVNGQRQEVLGRTPYVGHYDHQVIMHDGSSRRVVIPYRGIALICRLQYSLHEWNTEAEEYFAKVNGINEEWMRTQLGLLSRSDNKYLL